MEDQIYLIEWPKNSLFLAQINLRDPIFQNSFCGIEFGLSHPGILYFFNIYKNDQFNEYKVIYCDCDESKLKEIDYPEWYDDDYSIFIKFPQLEIKFFEAIGALKFYEEDEMDLYGFDKQLNEINNHMLAQDREVEERYFITLLSFDTGVYQIGFEHFFTLELFYFG